MTLGEACWLALVDGSMPDEVLLDFLKDIEDPRARWIAGGRIPPERSRRWTFARNSWACHHCGAADHWRVTLSFGRWCGCCGATSDPEQDLMPLRDVGLYWHDEWTAREERLRDWLAAIG